MRQLDNLFVYAAISCWPPGMQGRCKVNESGAVLGRAQLSASPSSKRGSRLCARSIAMAQTSLLVPDYNVKPEFRPHETRTSETDYSIKRAESAIAGRLFPDVESQIAGGPSV
jgi:hypothetical protein